MLGSDTNKTVYPPCTCSHWYCQQEWRLHAQGLKLLLFTSSTLDVSLDSLLLHHQQIEGNNQCELINFLSKRVSVLVTCIRHIAETFFWSGFVVVCVLFELTPWCM